MHVVPGEDGGPKWEDGSPFEWNNFVSNAAFGNSTLVISSGSDDVASEGEMLDVFAAAGVESGIWYSVKRANNISRVKPFRAYTICEFDASANWHERDVSQAHVPKQKQKCRKHQLLKVGLTLHRNMSRNAATNISGALATVMSAALGISSTALVHVPQCSNVDSTASVLGQWNPRGEARNGDGRRRMLSSAGTSVSVAYAIPSTVTSASVQAIDMFSVGEATTEQVYILSHDDQVVDAAPNVESISVEPADPEASADEKSGETVDTIMIVGVVGGVAVGLSLVGIVMMLNARKRKRRNVQERYNDCGSEHSNSDCSDDPGIVTDQTNSPRSGSESEGDNARDSARSHARSGTPDTPTSDFARKVTKERNPEEFHDDNGAAERARSKQPKRSRFNGVATNTKTKSTAAPVMGAAVSSASLSSGSLRNSLNVSHSKNTLVEMTEISEEDVVTMMANEASWKSQGSAGSWDGSGGLIEPNMMNIFEEQLTLEAAMKQESSHADGVFDADMHGMNDDLDLMFGQIMQAAPVAPSLNSCAIEPVSTSFENGIANSIPVLPGAAITATDLGDSGDLPPGWQAALDPKSGMIYYANVITHESSWEKPTWEGLIPAMGIGGGGAATAAAAAVEAERTANQKQGEGKKNNILQPDPRRRTSSADRRDRENALVSRRKGKKWTPEEDAYITKCVKETGASDWKKMGVPIMRTGAQCSQRWRKVLDPSVKRFVKWTPAEDAKLVQIYREHPNWTNKQVAELMPDRTPTQCHNRWNDKVNPSLRWGDWSPEEDKILWDKRQLGHSWSKIVKENPELMDRAHVAVKNRWHSLELARKRKKKNKAKGKGARKGK